jgi:DNA-binding HxlR family transcriptional regulator
MHIYATYYLKGKYAMSMRDYEAIKSVRDTPFGYTLSLISGKWKMIILYWLVEYPSVRYNELQRLLGTISFKTMSVQLKELEADELIIRKEYPQIPPKVEYSLSEKGKSLYPVMEAICQWGEQNQPQKHP